MRTAPLISSLGARMNQEFDKVDKFWVSGMVSGLDIKLLYLTFQMAKVKT